MEVSTRLIDIRPTKDKIAEIMKNQGVGHEFDWFEESLQEIADWVETKWRWEYAKLAENYANAIREKNKQILQLNDTIKKLNSVIEHLTK